MTKQTRRETEQQLQDVADLIVLQGLRRQAAYRAVALALRDGRDLTTIERLKAAYPRRAKQFEDNARQRLGAYEDRYKALFGNRPHGERVPVTLAMSSKGRLVQDLLRLARRVQAGNPSPATIDKLNNLVTTAMGLLG